jgi:tRNA/rRNA methyltransferase
MDLSVILVRPLYQGNVGAVARSMVNFGLSDLIIVGSFSVEEEARCRAKHANRVLDNIRFLIL